jgi:hypothetical protein
MRYGKDSRDILCSSVPVMKSGFDIVPCSYHPFSYYVLGGIDVSGDATMLNATVESDDSGDMATATGAGAGYDPRISGFDIAEMSGNDVYEQYREKAAKAKREEQSSGESSEATESTE